MKLTEVSPADSWKFGCSEHPTLQQLLSSYKQMNKLFLNRYKQCFC